MAVHHAQRCHPRWPLRLLLFRKPRRCLRAYRMENDLPQTGNQREERRELYLFRQLDRHSRRFLPLHIGIQGLRIAIERRTGKGRSLQPHSTFEGPCPTAEERPEPRCCRQGRRIRQLGSRSLHRARSAQRQRMDCRPGCRHPQYQAVRVQVLHPRRTR